MGLLDVALCCLLLACLSTGTVERIWLSFVDIHRTRSLDVALWNFLGACLLCEGIPKGVNEDIWGAHGSERGSWAPQT